jgi:CTP:molybdopterin cytidylyltransferase MocA
MALVILAAGRARRMGGLPKGLIPCPDRPLWRRHLESALSAGLRRVVLVLGENAPAFGNLEDQLPEGLTFQAVLNLEAESGLFGSIQRAIGHFGEDLPAGGLMFLPVDTAPIPSDVWERLARFSGAGRAVVIPCFEGRGGHPVWCSATFARHLAAIDGKAPEARLDVQIASLPAGVVCRLEVEAWQVLTNLNRPEDVEAFLKKTLEEPFQKR